MRERPEPPRTPAGLELLADPVLVDATEWDGVELRGDVGGPADVADVELVGCRLTGVRLTGRELVNLRLLDVVLEECELSGVRIAGGRLRGWGCGAAG